MVAEAVDVVADTVDKAGIAADLKCRKKRVMHLSGLLLNLLNTLLP